MGSEPRMKKPLLLALCLALSGCVTTGFRTTEKFADAQPPHPGYARLYIFRPGFSEKSSSDAPLVTIDGQPSFSLANESYSTVSLKGGSHNIRLMPQNFDSAIWQTETEIKVKTGEVHFLAIWNNTEYRKTIGFILLPGSALPVLPLPTESLRNKNIRFETVSESDALPVIQQCVFVKPVSDVID